MVKIMHLPNWPFIRRLLIVLFSSFFIISFVSIIMNALYLNHLSEMLSIEMLKFDSDKVILVGNSDYTKNKSHTSDNSPDGHHRYLDNNNSHFPKITTTSVLNKIHIFRSTPLNLGVIFTTFAYPSPSPDSKMTLSHSLELAHYNNTLRMLGRLHPKLTSLVFADEKQSIELITLKTNNIILPIPKKNVFGMPLLNRMFIKVMEEYSAFFYCYTNGDMLFPKLDLIKNLEIIHGLIEKELLSEKVLIIGSRTNVEYKTTALVYTDQEVFDLAAKGELHSSDAQDYIFVTRNSFDWHLVPDFVVGRPAYDNWLVDFAYHRGFSIIDLTQTLVAVHQTGPDGVKASHSSARGLDRKWNYSLAKGKVDHGSIDSAQYISSFRLSRRGAKIWTLTHKHQPNFYAEVEYDTSREQ